MSILSEEFLNRYKGKNPNWGFNGLGYVIYKRTYSRPLENRNEDWWETVARCVNGAQEIGADYCVDTETEILTKRGWLKYNEVKIGDETLSIDKSSGLSYWQYIDDIYISDYKKIKLLAFKGNKFDALTTKNHKWLVTGPVDSLNCRKWKRGEWRWTTSENLNSMDYIPLSIPRGDINQKEIYPDELVELVAWFWTEGCISGKTISIAQSAKINIEKVKRIERCLFKLYGNNGKISIGTQNIDYSVYLKAKSMLEKGNKSLSAISRDLKISRTAVTNYKSGLIRSNCLWSKKERFNGEMVYFYLSAKASKDLLILAPNKVPTMEFLLNLTKNQLDLFINTSVSADGYVKKWKKGRGQRLSQKDINRLKSFEIACVLSGKGVSSHRDELNYKDIYHTCLLTHTVANPIISKKLTNNGLKIEERDYEGIVWCPTVRKNNNWLARRNGSIYFTGNSKSEAERLYDYIFNLKCTYAGRMLWMLGTEHVRKWFGNALCNCFFISIVEPEDFCFLFENLMLGGGVGFSVKREDVHELPKVKENVVIEHQNTKDADFIVPDSRSGWVALLRRLLKSYFVTGRSFTYSCFLVRGYGEKIHGLGGTASGPAILIDGIEKICKVFNNRESKKLRSIDVLDICNIIGGIVVSGNLRRSAQIALGDPDDYLFLRAKRWDLGNIPNYRSNSNNTIYADEYSHIQPDVWEGYFGNGEPYGLFNLPLCKKIGRIGEFRKDLVEGVNPCFSEDTLIRTSLGDVQIKDLVGKIVPVFDGNKWVVIDNFQITGKNQELLEFSLRKRKNSTKEYSWVDLEFVRVTPYHKMILSSGEILEAKNIKLGEKLLCDSEKYIYEVKGIKKCPGLHTVYCCNVPTNHQITLANGLITAQCGELPLPSGGVCCLTDIFLNNISSKEELIDIAKLLYKTQKAVCNLNFLHEKTTKVVHRDYRIGIGITGVCQSLNKIEWLNETYKKLRDFDKEWSKQKCYPESVRLTTIKPSGSVSLLAGATPGVHPAFAKYYIRRVRMSSNDPLIEQCAKMGYKVEYVKGYDGEIDYKTMIVEFPCFAGETTLLAKDMTAIKQLELVKDMQTIWADNAISVSVYYKKEELPDIKKWLKENYTNCIKSVSFILHKDSGFHQQPYEEITKEKYEELISKVKPLTSLMIKGGDLESMECSTGACPIK